jgi:hypothetical protein
LFTFSRDWWCGVSAPGGSEAFARPWYAVDVRAEGVIRVWCHVPHASGGCSRPSGALGVRQGQ